MTTSILKVLFCNTFDNCYLMTVDVIRPRQHNRFKVDLAQRIVVEALSKLAQTA
ncbi:hypothetical protein AB0758_47925 [Tolypothrix bouteillei VB521301_2]|uniref:hypothetical protein n=1 Tax=Tolypothrix bouteillei TaxID=1246981 RepID=UPI0038B588A4